MIIFQAGSATSMYTFASCFVLPQDVVYCISTLATSCMSDCVLGFATWFVVVGLLRPILAPPEKQRAVDGSPRFSQRN